MNFMEDSLSKNLTDDDRAKALDSLRLLCEGVKIKDDDGNLIGFIEKPDLNAIKFILEKTESSDWNND